MQRIDGRMMEALANPTVEVAGGPWAKPCRS
jgi:hypothetical protein